MKRFISVISIVLGFLVVVGNSSAASWSNKEFVKMASKYEKYNRQRSMYSSVYEFPKYATKISDFYGEEVLTEEQHEILLSIYNEEMAFIASKLGIDVEHLDDFFVRYYKDFGANISKDLESSLKYPIFEDSGTTIQRFLIICDSPWCKDDGLDSFRINWHIWLSGPSGLTGDSIYIVIRNSQDLVVPAVETGYWRKFDKSWFKVKCPTCLPD